MPTLEATDPVDVLPEVPARSGAKIRERVAAHALVVDIARLHGDALLRTARRGSACADDAHDAYQRAMELLLAHAGTIDRGKAVNWLHVVVRREAMAIRRSHDRSVPLDDEDVEEVTARLSEQADERLHAIDLARRASEALATLKDTEAQALCMRAQGLSYEEIADAYGWSYTKVNRAVTEGRKAFVDHYLAVERGAVCGDTSELLSQFVAGDLKPKVALRMRAHLVRCSACRSLLHAERQADASLQALLPPAAVVATTGGGGWLHDHLLAPIGHAAGRLQPVADHLVGSKLGLVAASTLALAGSGVAVEHQIQQRQADPPALRTALTADRSQPANAATNTAATISLPAAVATAERRSDTIANAAERKAAAQRRATARKKAAQAAANRGEFAPAGGEFATATTKAARAAKSSGAATAASANAPAAEVPVTDTGSGASVDVATDAPSASQPSSSTVSDEFGP